MDIFNHQSAAGIVGAPLGIGQYAANIKRPETALETVNARLVAIHSRINANNVRAETAANAILGYEGERTLAGFLRPQRSRQASMIICERSRMRLAASNTISDA